MSWRFPSRRRLQRPLRPPAGGGRGRYPPVRADGATASASVGSALLSAFRIDGSTVLPSELTRSDAVYGVQVTPDGELRCDAPCGFGTTEGRYRFTMEAAGYRPRSLDVEAVFEGFSGGCPSSNSGSTVITPEMTPEP